MSRFYDPADLEDALRASGVRAGDVIFSHLAPARLGLPKGARQPDDVFAAIHGAMRAVLGPTGTWLVPSFTYSFTKGEVFDPAATPSAVGRMPDWLRERGGARSLDPLFSVVGEGPAVPDLFRDLPPTSFGRDCLFQRLLEADAKIVNIGLDLDFLTFSHHVDWELGLPLRFDKLFHGTMITPAGPVECDWTYSVRHLMDNTIPDLTRFIALAAERGLRRSADMGNGRVAAMDCRAIRALMHEVLPRDPWFMVRGPAVAL